MQVALEKILQKAKATTAAIWATIVTTENWMKTTCPVESLAKISLLPSTPTSPPDGKCEI